MGLGGGKKNGIGGPNLDRESGWCPGMQVCMWARSVYWEHRKLAFVAVAQLGDDLGKGHWGQFVKGRLLHVKYKITSIQLVFFVTFLLSPSPLHLTIATLLQTR